MADENTTLTLEQQNANLIAEIAALKAAAHAAPKLSIKVSEKGAISIYGLGRFPVTLYKSQVERLFAPDMVARVNEFVVAHAAELKVKE